MLRNGWKSILYLNGLQVAQYAFIVIAAVIGIAVYGLYGVKSGEIFESPVLTVQILLVFSYPFCYLLLKNIRKNMEEDPDAQRAPLWFLLILQLSSLNMVMILLLGFGILQTYGKSFFTKEAFKISPQNRSLMISMIPLAFLYALILFVRVRLNMI